MGICTSTPADDEHGGPERRYRQKSIIDEELARAIAEGYSDPESSDGRMTTENQMYTSLRVKATNVQSRIVHGINADADQFCEEFQNPDALLTSSRRKGINYWLDDQLQVALRAHLVERLPKQSVQLLTLPPLEAFQHAPTPHTINDSSFMNHPDEDGSNSISLRSPHTVKPLQSMAISFNTSASNHVITSPLTSLKNASSTNNAIADDKHSNSSGIAWAGTGTVSLLRIVDMELLIWYVNDFCRRSVPITTSINNNGSSSGSLQQQQQGTTNSKPLNRKRQPVSLNDPLVHFTLGKSAATNAAASTATTANKDKDVVASAFPVEEGGGAGEEVCQEYIEHTYHLRMLDRNSDSAPPNVLSPTSLYGGAVLSEPATPAMMLTAHMSTLSTGNPTSAFGSDGTPPIGSPLSGNSNLDMMASSPYAAHGSPWRDRVLNFETMKVHNRLIALREKQQPQATTNQKASKGNWGAQNVEDRKAKPLRELLFGPRILQAYHTEITKTTLGNFAVGGNVSYPVDGGEVVSESVDEQ